MAAIPPENGVDGDDEREDEEEDDDLSGDEDGEEEDEPKLKYQRMGGSLPSLLTTDSATCVAVSERMIALGTHGGIVHILDFLGNQLLLEALELGDAADLRPCCLHFTCHVKEFPVHNAAVNSLSFDIDGEFIGSCSDDGSIVISSLFTDEKRKFEYHRPMKAIALDPDYAKKSSRRFVAGGLAGQLIFYTKKWLGYQEQVLHSGEGPIHAVTWRTSLIAWANDAGIKVYDTADDQRVTYIERPRGSPHPELLLPHLVWQEDSLLIIGWGTSVKIASIRANIYGGVNGSYKPIPISNGCQVDIVASFQTNYYISGIAPFGDSLAILAYIRGEEDGEKDFSSTAPSRQGNAQRPEVHIVTWTNDELATDALPVHGFEHYKAKDYCLSHTPFSGSSYVNGRWAAGDEPLYYVVSPKDIVIAKPRDVEDHVNWLLERGQYDKALVEVEATQGRKELYEEVGSRYLDHLLAEKKYDEAASLCPKILCGSASAWERCTFTRYCIVFVFSFSYRAVVSACRWMIRFAQLRQLPVLVPYMPTGNPKLSDTLYELALVSLAMNPAYHKEFLSAVKSWPRSIYSVLPVLSEIEPQLRASMMTDSLKEALAELYVRTGQHEKAFSLYADLLNPEVFDFIEKHNLHDSIREKVVQLMMLDSKRATTLLIQQRDLITPSDVVSQLLAAGNTCDFRYFLYLYLHSLFEVNPHAGKDFHDMQVELYADYDPKMLHPFLRSSQHYTLEKAHEICVRKGFLKEQAFILGRMGNSKQALAVIINQLGDMEEALEFAGMQNDDEVWEELIKQSTQRPEMVGMLLEHTVGNLDPLHIVNVVPDGLEIPRLRDRLVKIVTDYRTETSLRHGCNDILKADIVNLLIKYYKEARHAVYLGNEEDEARAKRNDNRTAESLARAPSLRHMDLKSKTRAGGRCCMCFDPLTIQNVSVVVFFCCHAYHLTCYMDSSNTFNDGKKARNSFSEYEEYDDEEENDNESQSGVPRMRCILCTNAGG
ncbi:hypothetical protein Cgig2_021113 [Carnegiea gigantea]|uniref:Vacuolar protein sorting-associated protein 41 homolog n=1 Tax=Carnegiea gigantea TaxID=171969 RepID=A0A9Q1Q808_9CARY|nr:hypothetical protein Cgig2_021113 [Carnegiea gigantea]